MSRPAHTPTAFQAPAAPWTTPLAEAMRRSHAHAAAFYAQLATRARDGAPRCRTIVVRGLVREEGALIFCTDTRSPKVEQIEADPRAELCWYFVGLREQFRLAGEVVLTRGDEEKGEGAVTSPPWLSLDDLWTSLSSRARAAFFGPPPGAPRTPEMVIPTENAAPRPPPSFAAGALIVREVDHLRLRTSPHKRTHYTRDEAGAWLISDICP